MREGFSRYVSVYKVDIPLYDKLYQEFDSVREDGRYPLEVYLGRDGIYAWIGRRTQDLARRRKVPLNERIDLETSGEIMEINPKYLVYPRYFRDNLSYSVKRKFLEQEGVAPESDPLFYDTGYIGTIPEQIMSVMGFEAEDIEARIRLLSARSANRRINGVLSNARQDIIEHIEQNAKTEESAVGLVIDEKTGKIRHVAKPVNPEEQFYFMMIKQAIIRHYWLQEQLYYEPSINLDSEHHKLRIQYEYSELMPSEFLNNPKTFLKDEGELLKGSNGTGEYPDEEITLFKLTDGTEVVAKKVELRKSKEARKEFDVLVAAKKAGLMTAEPVGFVSGKESSDASYLLMKKLDGYSGRTFEKELRDSKMYTEQEIQRIINDVSIKNKEVAELFRQKLGIDKDWRIKDTIIIFNIETRQVEKVIPIDWKRVLLYNPSNPQEIENVTLFT